MLDIGASSFETIIGSKTLCQSWAVACLSITEGQNIKFEAESPPMSASRGFSIDCKVLLDGERERYNPNFDYRYSEILYDDDPDKPPQWGWKAKGQPRSRKYFKL